MILRKNLGASRGGRAGGIGISDGMRWLRDEGFRHRSGMQWAVCPVVLTGLRRPNDAAGTAGRRTDVPPAAFFLPARHPGREKGRMSQLKGMRKRDAGQVVASPLKRKAKAVIQVSDAGETQPDGRIRTANGYAGGNRSAGKCGRGAACRALLVRAGGTTRKRKFRRRQLTAAEVFRRRKNIVPLGGRASAGGATILVHGPCCRDAVENTRRSRVTSETGSDPTVARRAPFRRADITLRNIDAAPAGARHELSAKCARNEPGGSARGVGSGCLFGATAGRLA